MSHKFDTIAFDADDTLWENEVFFRLTQARFAELLSDFTERDHLESRLLEAEKRNLGHYGFGIKGFVLSMIETAIDVTDEKVPASIIKALVAEGREMLRHPVNLLEGVQQTIEALAPHHKIFLVTKGDLLHQEHKLAQSGLGDLFDGVEIVSDKSPQTYTQIFGRYDLGPERTMMVGNSMKSDVIPPIQAGAWGTFIAHEHTWEIEHAQAPDTHPRYNHLDQISALPGLIEKLSQS